MVIFKPLLRRDLRVLWLGQLFSSIGDEIYKVALIWMAADLLGSKAGYIAALQFGAVFIFGLLGGRWIDRFSPFRTMVTSDLLRALIVLAPPIFYFWFGNQLWLLCAVAIIVAGLSVFFDPALQSCLVHLAEDRKLLQATNGLFDSTKRFARILGPALVGLLGIYFSSIHFFTIDSLTFFASTISILVLGSKLKNLNFDIPKNEADSVIKNIGTTWKLISKNSYTISRNINYAFGWAMWYLSLGLALPLYLNAKPSAEIDTYAYILMAYGFGNVLSNFYFSGFETRYASRMMFGGAGLVGFGMFLLPFSDSLLWMMSIAALAAIGGPMDDLFVLKSVQSEYSSRDMTRVLRFLMTISQGLTLFVFLVSPIIFEFISPRWVIAVAGMLMFLANLLAFIRYRNETLALH